MEASRPKASLAERWGQVRPTKTIVFWACVASVVATLTVGFTWGGWVTGGTARAMALAMGEEAVVKRLAPICVAQFKHGSDRDRKLEELTAVSEWQRGDYVHSQGWATMPGEQEGDRQVARECARQLTRNSK